MIRIDDASGNIKIERYIRETRFLNNEILLEININE